MSEKKKNGLYERVYRATVAELKYMKCMQIVMKPDKCMTVSETEPQGRKGQLPFDK